MTYTTLAVIALICVSGFIAYFGDLLGRRMGKKRLTLFHLRPRYTAIVVTTITGMVISALALTVLVSIDPTFRKIFSQGEKIIKLNRQLTDKNQTLEKLGKELRAAVARQKRELKVALNDADLAKRRRDVAENKVAVLRREIALRLSELADLRKRKGIAEAELRDKRSELGMMQSQLEREQEQLRVAQLQVSKTQEQLGVAEAKLKKTQDDLTAAQAALSETTSVGIASVDLALELRFKDIVFRQGDELARGIIDPSATNIELRHQIHALLNAASKRALEGGAKIGSNGRAVNLRYQQRVEKADALLIRSDEAACVEMAADKIASANTNVLVQVVCASNALPGEQVPVELRLYLNDLIFKVGDMIAGTKIDGRQSEGHILLAMNSFLQTEVTKAAAKAGVVPVAGQDPRAALELNTQAQADELLKLVAKVKSMNAVADVSVYATGDVHTADSLNMSNISFGAAKAR